MSDRRDRKPTWNVIEHIHHRGTESSEKTKVQSEHTSTPRPGSSRRLGPQIIMTGFF
jgi:hypothetical protein